jgi:hypothetical protein
VSRGDELANATLFVEGDVEVEGELLVGELHLRAGAALRPSTAGTTPDAIRIRASGDLVLDAGSTVDVSTKGTWRASDLDLGSAPDREGDGGPHGGDAGVEGALRAAYGSASEPVQPGARGGIAGTFGGGVVSLFAKRIVLAGVVEANGEDGNADRPAWRGLGAGGSIRLVAEEVVTGPVDRDMRDVEDRKWGFLSARGGAPSTVEAVPFAGAFAAGGRLSLRAPRLVVPLLDVSGTQVPDGTVSGRPGTIFVRDALRPDGVLLVPPATGSEAWPAGKAP